MDFKKIFGTNPNQMVPQNGLTAQSGYNLARFLRFYPLFFMYMNLRYKYFTSFTGTISGRVLTKGQFQELPNGLGNVTTSRDWNMEVSVHFNKWSDAIDIYYLLHLFCTNVKYVILFFVFSQVANIFKSISEKQIFEDNNINTLRFMGLALSLIYIFDHLAIYIMTEYVGNHPEMFSKLNIMLFPRLNFLPQNSMLYFFSAQLFYMAVIEIFRYGLQLKSENDLTV